MGGGGELNVQSVVIEGRMLCVGNYVIVWALRDTGCLSLYHMVVCDWQKQNNWEWH